MSEIKLTGLSEKQIESHRFSEVIKPRVVHLKVPDIFYRTYLKTNFTRYLFRAVIGA